MLRLAGVTIAGIIAALAAIWASGEFPRGFGLPPSVEQQRAALMTQLGETSVAGKGFEKLESASSALSARAPLEAAPFLVVGAIEEQNGKTGSADRLYRAALARDPRSQGAHFMLAGRALAGGDADLALRHLASLARQTQGAGSEFGKLMVAVANDPAMEPSVRRFLAREPRNREVLFTAMAVDPSLTERLFVLAAPTPGGPPPDWLPALVRTEVMADRADRAAVAWARYGGGGDPRQQTIRDGRFRLKAPSAPLGWAVLPNDSAAVAAGERGLDVEIYGHAAQPLLTQWTFLAPGQYSIRPDTSASLSGLLEWRIGCLGPAGAALAAVPVDKAATFTVPDGCNAQAIDLWTRFLDNGAQDDATGQVHSLVVEQVK